MTDFGGLDTAGKDPYGIADMVNFSPRRAPSLAVRRPRELLATSQNVYAPHGMAVMNGDLYVAQGFSLYRLPGGVHAPATGGTMTQVGYLGNTDKQMAVFGDRLIILPDKKYLDAADGQLRAIELDTGEIDGVVFAGDCVTLPMSHTWTAMGFAAGDTLTIVNADDVTPAPGGDYCIRAVYGNKAYLQSSFHSTYESRARFRRRMPDLDGFCVAGNRLYGYKGKNIFISGEGSPFGWYGTRSDGTGPVTLRSDSEGDITAVISHRGDVVFFKSDRICRLLGGHTDPYALGELTAPGVPPVMARSLADVGGDLYYHADTGLYRLAYGATYPERLGSFSPEAVTDACGGTDGVGYYADLHTDPASRTYLYRPDRKAWYVEDGPVIRHMAYMDGCLCRQDTAGRLWVTRSDGGRIGCAIDEETVTGPICASLTFRPDHRHEPTGYRLVNLYLRATSEPGAELRVLASFGEGTFCRDTDPTAIDPALTTELAHLDGGMTDRLLRIPLTSPLCDSSVLRLETLGTWEISTIIREYEIPETG